MQSGDLEINTGTSMILCYFVNCQFLLCYSELNVRHGKTSTDLSPEVSFGPRFKLGPKVCLLFGWLQFQFFHSLLLLLSSGFLAPGKVDSSFFSKPHCSLHCLEFFLTHSFFMSNLPTSPPTHSSHIQFKQGEQKAGFPSRLSLTSFSL